MLNLLPLVCVLWTCADTPAAAPVAPAEVVAALETSLADSIERVEPSVVAIARIKSENGETTAVRGRNRAPIHTARGGAPRQFFSNGNDVVSFDYGSGVVIGDGGEILTAFHVV